MNIRTTQAVTRRLQWALEENKAIKQKTLALVQGLNLNDADVAMWSEITEHIASVESHLRNALGALPALPEPVRDDQPLVSEQEQLAQSAYCSPTFWQGQKSEASR